MLSILIPVYNYDARPLVAELCRQCAEAHVVWEIIVMDDGSQFPWPALNEEITRFAQVRYLINSKNIGRAAIRNRLARAASHNHLLFLDCDGMPLSGLFIRNYLPFLVSGDKVICGGRVYPEKKPDKPFLLHWKYGITTESQPAGYRNRNPHRSFMTSNFLVTKRIMERFPFDESISGYGHEDTIFGYRLKKAGIPVVHINNAVVHNHLETSEQYLLKTATAVSNLKRLYQQHPELKTEVSLLKWYYSGSSLIVQPAVALAGLLLPQITAQLKSESPSMALFALYKLILLKKSPAQ